MKMNICFLSNFSKTYLLEAVGNKLAEQGFNIFWIVTNGKLYNHLSTHYKEDNILLINKSYIDKFSKPLGEYKINEIIFGDRVLKHEPKKALKFLNHIQRPIYHFLKTNEIRNVFGEITWAHEILIHRICTQQEELNCQFLNPHVVRIPDGRFAFFSDERQSEILEIKNQNKFYWKSLKPKTPKYLAINQEIQRKTNSLQGRLEKIKKFMLNRDLDILDPTLRTNTKKRLLQKIQEEWKKEQYKIIKTSSFESVKDTSYVFLGLHKQPEASVDVFGRYYENQLQNILNLWRTLPSGWKLVVKEHGIAVGDRPKAFFEKIQGLPNVVLVDEETPSYDIIKNAKLVATVTGTIAYEAALMGVPSVTFAPSFFNKLHLCKQISLEDLNQFNLKEISEGLKKQMNNLEYFSKFIYKNSFYGNVLDPISDPTVLDEENVKLLAIAFAKSILFSERFSRKNKYNATAA